ncbi:phosphoenolpyruvate mutase [Microcoleus vaginatus]|uniref:phosphoenolpyruvate mutase n=1 Tax=Microcoleus vaginatus TaxID=119532 RepID=UPI001F603A2E
MPNYPVIEKLKMLKKTTQLKNMLLSKNLEFLVESHNGISAKIAEEAGFKGIWASGLSISGQLGVRDNNEASWTQVLEVIEFMSDGTSIPILLDGDTGYGNFNNVQRLIKKLEQRNIAGVCLEDKLFPKTNSFIKGDAQPLADIEEFSGKIKAAKDAQNDDDFVVIARVEAFIAGWTLSEAIKRAEAYYQAGADGILIHSALRIPDEILAFKREWGDRCPVVIVPTKYYSTPTEIFRDNGFSIVIWANHLFRSAVTAMQQVTKTLMKEQNLLNIEDSIVSVSEIFRLQGATELLESEKRYLPKNPKGVGALILAASRGIQLGKLTEERPKCMLDMQGHTLLSRIVDTYRTVGIKDITVVRGYKKDVVDLPNLHYVDNDNYGSSGELVSLHLGLKNIADDNHDLIVGYGDVLFKKYILQMLLDSEEDFVVVVDSEKKSSSNNLVRKNYADCSLPYSKDAFYTKVYLQQIDRDLTENQRSGMWTGLLKVSERAKPILLDVLNTLLLQPEIQQRGRMLILINELIRRGYRVEVLYISGHWLNVDQIQDMLKAEVF